MIHYIDGDATYPIHEKDKNVHIIIPHICNNLGLWGSGFVLALSKRWPITREIYLNEKSYQELGKVRFIQVERYIIVANMIAQDGIRKSTNMSPIRYDYLDICLNYISIIANIRKKYNDEVVIPTEIHMPKIGSDRAGGDWNKIEKMIEKIFNVPVYIYNYKG